MQTPTVVDFETFGIQPRPAPAPAPVGVAIRHPNGITEYLAFAHPNGKNNATKEEAYRALCAAWRGPVVFHNAKFDLEVAWQHFGLQYPRCWHDTMFLAFLDCPHAQTFALKPTAERVLGLPPTARDLVREWVLCNVLEATAKNWGAYIALAPVDLVAPYAMADVTMTWGLFNTLHPRIEAAGMGAAYARERWLMPWLLDAELRGVRVDRNLLGGWSYNLNYLIDDHDEQVRKRLRAPGLNLDEDRAVADAIDKAGLVAQWELTATGQRATNKGAMLRQCSDSELLKMLSTRNTAATMLRSFVDPWLAASATDGRLHTAWNQTRSIDGTGTRTGRIGSERPNLANVPNPVNGLPSLRRAFLPEEGELWLKADYSQQEFRLTGHFENGAIMRAYQANPDTDFHTLVQELVSTHTGKKLSRLDTKRVNFTLLYGGGVPRLATVLETDAQTANDIYTAYFTALPGLRQLRQQINQVCIGPRRSVRTLGGRIMPLEPPKIDKDTGLLRTFEYKMPNKLVQGSAADMTKEALVQFGNRGTGAKLLLTVYDEIDVSAKAPIGTAMVLDETMRTALPCDVPMRVDMMVGNNWGDLQTL
jgi:DNA polymerase-1